MATTYNFIAANKRRSIGLVLFFIVFAGLIGWLVGYLYDIGWLGAVYALVIALPYSLISYYSSDKISLALNGAHPIDPERSSEERQVYRLVENLAITAGIPMPKVYLIVDEAMNAFATGRDPEHASIAITTGLLGRLEKSEVEGVIAHELSHVKNYDIRLSTLVVVLVGFIAILSDFFLRFSLFGGRRRRSDNEGNTGAILAVIGLVLLILAPIVARLISLAVSRQREYLADASGTLLTRYPDGLARALAKIGQDEHVLQRASSATMHLYLADPYEGENKERRAGIMERLFATHPPIAERIARLRNMNSAQ